MKKMIKKNKKGYSFIEVIVVIGIIALLFAIAGGVRQYMGKVVISTLKANITNINKALKACLTLNPLSDCNSFQKLGIKCDSYGMGRYSRRITHSSPLPANYTFIGGNNYPNTIIKGLHCSGRSVLNNAINPQHNNHICIEIVHEKKPWITFCTDNKGNTKQGGNCIQRICR